jgi:hypothetical protein
MSEPEAQGPQTPEEWQEAADLATFWLHVDAARAYGLVKGGPPVDADRCEALLAAARGRGVRPAPDAVERYTARMLAGEAL